jgi:hypothetical protein
MDADMDEIIVDEWMESSPARPQTVKPETLPEPVVAVEETPVEEEKPDPKPKAETPAHPQPSSTALDDVPSVRDSSILSTLIQSFSAEDESGEGADAAVERTARRVTIILRSNGDKMRDVIKINRIHGHLLSFHGSDQFVFYVFENEKSYLLEFPSFTTGICSELIQKLQGIIPKEDIQVEDVVYQ